MRIGEILEGQEGDEITIRALKGKPCRRARQGRQLTGVNTGGKTGPSSKVMLETSD